MKKFKTKKVMWKRISSDIKEILNLDKTELQCENRYKTILKRKKKAVDNNNRSGATRDNVEYGEELKKICAIDDSLEPEVLRGVGQVSYKEPNIECCVLQDSNSEVEESPILRKKQKTVADTLKELHQMKEENKERRHQEKIGVMKELLNLLKKE